MCSFDLNIIHALRAVDFRIYLAHMIMVTQYQPRAMIFVLNWKNLIFLIYYHLLPTRLLRLIEKPFPQDIFACVIDQTYA